MESSVKGDRKPVSLNDRHYRQLQCLSSAQSKCKTFVDNDERNVEMKSSVLQGKFISAIEACGRQMNFEVEDGSGPCFSGIVDFDSSPGGASSQKNKCKANDVSDAEYHCEDDNDDTGRILASNSDSLQECCNQEQRVVTLDCQLRDCKLSCEDLENNFACSVAKGECHSQNEFEDEFPQIYSQPDYSLLISGGAGSSGADCLDNPKETLTKVKLEGRRRLCKFKTQADKSASSQIAAENEYQDDEYAETNSGVGEICDIIDDLNNKLGHLSIVKSKSTNARGEVPSNEYNRSAAEKALREYHFGGYSVPVARNEAIASSVDESLWNRYDYSVLDSNKAMCSDVKGMNGNDAVANLSFVSNIKDKKEGIDDAPVTNVKENIVKPRNRCGASANSFKYNENVDTTLETDFFILSGPVSCFKLHNKIANLLYPHQRDGLQWLWTLHCLGKGGILGDDMGLGKTMQICAFLAGLFHSKLIKRVLVVAPKTLLSHWIKELSIVGLSGMTREYYGTSKSRVYELQYILQEKGVLLTTYDIVRNNWKSLKGIENEWDEESDDVFCWDYMMLDEGHLIKNPSTQRARSLLELPCTHRIVISGTPIQNNLKELWALFNFCCPGLLGDNKGFKEKYEQYIIKGNDKNASDRDKSIGSTVAKDLRDKIHPYFLRRMKSDVFKGKELDDAKLSTKNEIIVWLKLTNCQRQLYQAFLQSELVLSAFDGSPLAALTILKKICDHPLLLTKRAAEDVLEGMDSMISDEDACLAEKLAQHVADTAERNVLEEKHDSISCKISFIMSLLHKLLSGGHRVLIFSQTRKMLNIIQDTLLTNGYQFMRIDGATKACDRVKIVNEFQMGHGAPILLLTSQVGGLGLTLTRADRVIVVDPAWNPSTDNQSVDRAYRIGQKNDVVVYRLMTCGTVEEKIYRKQIFKGGLFKSATEHKEQIRYFSQQDLRELFSLPKEGFDISLTQKQLHEEHDSQHAMEESLVSHISFLETLGIAGVSHHNLLFSKTMPLQKATEEETGLRKLKTCVTGMPSSNTHVEVEVDGAEFAFDPKDSVWKKRMASPNKEEKLTESKVKEKITRLSHIANNKSTMMRLPDGGAKIVQQIEDLKTQLSVFQIHSSGVDDVTIHLGKALTFS